MEARQYTNRKYLDLLDTKVVVFDGAMGTSLQKMNLTASHFGGERLVGCNDHLVLSYPAAVEAVHRSFMEAGVDVIETCTFRSNRLTLAEYGLADKVTAINTAAAQLARRVADEYSQPGHPRLVAGSIGPSGKLPSIDDPQLSDITFEQLCEIFREQAAGLVSGGVDLLLIETSQDILEVKAAILGIQQAFSETGIWLPIQAQVTLDTTGRMLLGTDIQAVTAILDGLPIDVIGLNCSTGPEHMREPIRILNDATALPVSCIPNAGLPLNVDGQAVYPLQPEPFAEMLADFVDKYHVRVVGGCCGTTPEHLRQLVGKVNTSRAAQVHPPLAAYLASGTTAVSSIQVPAPFLIGERLNAQGSAKFKQLLLANDYDGMVSIARVQVDNGAHGLDVCVALTERGDEAETMRKVIKKVSAAVKAPFIIDSTEADVIEAALQTAPGKCLINSTNLESGPAKAQRVFSLAKKYNAAVMVLTIDEAGMARTAERKLEIAKRLVGMAVEEYHLKPGDVVIDALTFTLGTGDPDLADSAHQTLLGIQRIKAEIPGVLTSLGVSNVSFGLSANSRGVLNSVMLHHAVQAGLDMAIVNTAQIIPYADLPRQEIDLCEDLILNRRSDALPRFIEHFSGAGTGAVGRAAAADPLQGLGAAERLQWKILHRVKDGVDTDIDELILPHSLSERGASAVKVLNEVLLPAMKVVGDKFGNGELILPFVLQSAEVMKTAVSHLEAYLDKQAGTSKGKMVLATVYGDVHDIGKNLVKTILSNNGFEVVDLGKQVPAETIISRAVEENADAIGLSALLVSTSKQMQLIVNELDRRGLAIPVLIGGAAINDRFGQRILLTEDGRYYPGGVFYCKDAFEGLNTMESLRSPESRAAAFERIQRGADLELGRLSEKKSSARSVSVTGSVQPAATIPVAPDYSVHLVQELPLREVFTHLSINELFRLSWGAKNQHGDEWEKTKADYTTRLERMQNDAIHSGWLKPQGVYAFLPAQSEGNDLLIYDPARLATGEKVEIECFSFPRQGAGDGLCLADYFAPVSSGRMDVVGFQVVTVGAEATKRFDELQAAGEYTEAYFSHGLAVQTAEAAAATLHQHLLSLLNLPAAQGKRYSWGYPAIPDLADHARVFRLLQVEKLLGMTLTSAYQLVPEQSTAAIIVHHPQASYFNIGESRIDQLTRNQE
jgi:5-methyltetrahydrofolate--homocysteine methyltransferase